MFEEWVGDVITRFVGHFLDVKKDQLRVSLWSGKYYSLVQLSPGVRVHHAGYY